VRRPLAAVALATLAPVALAACSGGGGERTVTLDIHHSRFSAGDISVRPGETVRFVLRNTDPIPHELIIGDQSVQDRHEAGTEAHHGDRPGEVSVAPGATAVTTYTFDRAGGTLLFGCHLPGHWAYGMRGTIRVG
jgi:uncharacterized cupredoxin-like copper-binding protein